MARFRKVSPVIWNDARFRALSDDGKLGFLFLLTHPTMTALGAMRATVAGLTAELGWPARRLRNALAPAIAEKMIVIDETASFIRLQNFLRYNGPENPNQVRGWSAAADLIPECSGKVELLADARSIVTELGEPFFKAFVERFGERLSEPFGKRLRQGLAIQEQEQEQEEYTGDETPPESPASDPLAGEFEKIKAAYPKRDGDQRWRKALGHYRAARKGGATAEAIVAGVQRYAVWCERRGIAGSERVKQAATFLAPDDPPCWAQPWNTGNGAIAEGFVG